MGKFKRITFLTILFCSLFSCKKDLPVNEAGLRTLVAQIESDREVFTKSEHTWRSGDVTSSFTAFSRNDQVFLIEENMTRGESGLSENRFYFFTGKLFCYREKRINRDESVLEIEILFGREGEVVAQKQVTDGKPSEMAGYVVSLAKKHGKTLKDLVDKREE